MASLVLSDGQILAQLADGVKKSVPGLPNYWPRLIARSHSWAVNQIIARLACRGYSLAQIQAADQTSDYEYSLTLFWAFKNGGIPEGYGDVNLKALDAREELKDIVLTQAGAFINPAGPQGLPHSGLMSAPDDIFAWPPPDGTPPFPPGEFAQDDGKGSRF